MISSPPPLQAVRRTPAGLSVLTGLTGLAVALGAGASGFPIEFEFGISFFYAAAGLVAIIALAGAVLALMQHEAGPPLVAGSAIVFAVHVATTMSADRFDMEAFVDRFEWRSLAFFGGGAAAVLAAVLGLASLRGRGRPGWGVATILLGLGVLGCHAALVGLDDRQEAFVVHPTVGLAVAVLAMAIGAFVGRAGSLVGAATAACLIPTYLEYAEFPSDRRRFAVLAVVGLAVLIALSVATAVSASRQPVVQYFGRSEVPWGSGVPGEPTQVFPVQGYQPPTPQHQPPQHQPPQYQPSQYQPTQDRTAQYPLSQFATSDRPTQQLPAISEAAATTRLDDRDAADMPTGVMQAIEADGGGGAAQWASDPFGRHQLRYWDGTTWTQHVSDFGTGAVDPV